MAPSTIKKVFLAGFASLAIVVLAVAGVVFLTKPVLEIDPYIGRAYDPPLEFPQFRLFDQRGKSFDNNRLRGQWSIAMIGFTYCPDVCPTTVSNVAAALTKLSSTTGSGDMPRFIFFSVDPFRDTPEVLGNYIEYYNKEFIGVTGEPEKILSLVKKLGLHYAYTDPEDGRPLDEMLTQPAQDDYGVIHSTRLLFISPEAKLAASMSWPYTPQNILNVYQQLRTHYGG